jgi:dTDP-4-dehydrorhamnose reductase
VKLFITGISGLLGLNIAWQTRDRFQVSGGFFSHPVSIRGVNAARLDASDRDEVKRAITAAQPDLIINAVGLANVDECESDRPLAQRLNADCAEIVAGLAHQLKISLVHISTDHLFDGSSPGMTETDTPQPINNYAATKLKGEIAVREVCPEALIIRTNFFGWGTTARPSFTDWVLRGLAEKQVLTMFTDVFFTPILITDLVEAIIDVAESGATGIFNVVGQERLSKHAFALKTADAFGYSTENIVPTNVADFQFRAHRPQDMSLNCAKIEELLGRAMPDVTSGLKKLKGLGLDGVPAELEAAFASQVNRP